MGMVMLSGFVVSGVVALQTTPAPADLVAAWSFNGLDGTSAWLPSDAGDAWMDLGPLHSSSHLFKGTDLNAPAGWGPGDAIGLQGPEVESGSLLLGIESGLGAPGIADPVQVSFAARRSDTGFDRVSVESWSAGSWRLLDSLTIETTWGLHEVSPIEIDPLSGLLLRFTMEGSSSSLGTIRFDNLRIDAMPVPAPATAALLGVGGLLGAGGRRRS